MKGSLILILLIAFVLLICPAQASKPDVIVILWHGLSWKDVVDMDLPENIAVGIMNTRIGGGDPVTAAYLTIGSGSRAFGTSDAAGLLHTYELVNGYRAKDIYQLRTGRIVDNGQIVNLDIATVTAAEQQANYPLQVGALAYYLTCEGRDLGVFGNSDLTDRNIRWAALVGMNAYGVAPTGMIDGRLNIADVNYPHGIHTNYDLLLEEVVNANVDVAIIDLGDPYRYSTYEQYMNREQQQLLRQQIALQCWEFITELQKNYKESELLIISPYPQQSRAKSNHWLAPVLMIGRGKGVLNSATTKWPGLIANIDIAPTILATVNITSSSMIGRPIFVEPVAQAQPEIDLVVGLDKRIIEINTNRNQVLRFIVGLQICLYITTLICLVIPRRLHPAIIRLIQLVMLFSLSIPLISLLLASSWIWAAAAIAILPIVFLLGINQLIIISVIGMTTVGILIYDLLSGFWLMRFSYLGYDPIGGARFYGIGNEYMGVLIGALIISWSLLKCQSWVQQNRMLKSKYFDLTVFGLASIFIAAPWWGTNVGGMFTALVGFGITWFGMHQKLSKIKAGVIIVLLVGVALSILAYIDYQQPETARSHIGQATALIQREGIAAAAQIVTRKISMNVKLFRYSIWSRVLVVAIMAMGASLIWPSRYLKWLIDTYPVLVVGIVGVLAATVTALIFNDSGVVAAATCSSYAAITMLNLALGLKHNLLPS